MSSDNFAVCRTANSFVPSSLRSLYKKRKQPTLSCISHSCNHDLFDDKCVYKCCLRTAWFLKSNSNITHFL